MSEQQSPLARRADTAKDVSTPNRNPIAGRHHDRQFDAVLLSMIGVTLFVGLVIGLVFRALHP